MTLEYKETREPVSSFLSSTNGVLTIIHVVLSLDVGGLERVILDLVHRGRLLGQKIVIVCLERPGALAPLAKAAGAEILCVDKPPGRRPETVGHLRDIFKRQRPDVIHTHQIGALFYAGRAAKLAGLPAVVHTEHINHAAKRTGVVSRLKIRLLWAWAGRYSRRFFGVSEDIVEAVASFYAVPRNKLAVVRNGINTGAFAPSPSARAESDLALASIGVPNGVKIVGTVGRLAEVKRHDLLIKSFASISRGRTDVALVIVGDGPERSNLEALARSLGVENLVHFAGYRERPESLLLGMDIFALTSRIEGLPLVILEAWAAGIPVVASKVGGIPALIDHGRTGLLFDAGDQATLTRLVVGLLDDPDSAERIGMAGQARAVAEFDATVMAEAYDRHYREVMAQCQSKMRG